MNLVYESFWIHLGSVLAQSSHICCNVLYLHRQPVSESTDSLAKSICCAKQRLNFSFAILYIYYIYVQSN